MINYFKSIFFLKNRN